MKAFVKYNTKNLVRWPLLRWQYFKKMLQKLASFSLDDLLFRRFPRIADFYEKDHLVALDYFFTHCSITDIMVAVTCLSCHGVEENWYPKLLM